MPRSAAPPYATPGEWTNAARALPGSWRRPRRRWLFYGTERRRSDMTVACRDDPSRPSQDVRRYFVSAEQSCDGPTSQRFTRETHSRARGQAARRLPRLEKGSAGASCKRRDAVRLAQHEPARPAGAAFGVSSGATSSWAAPIRTTACLLKNDRSRGGAAGLAETPTVAIVIEPRRVAASFIPG